MGVVGSDEIDYDFVASQSASDPGSDLVPTLITPDLLNNAVGSDEIDYDFVGFDPGDIFQFEADVDRDVSSLAEDYRVALFPDAVLTVGFSNGQTLSQVLNPDDTGLDGYTFAQAVPMQTTPEPASLLGLSSLVCLGLGGAARRKRSAQ